MGGRVTIDPAVSLFDRRWTVANIYKCAGCDMHYCVNCDGGVDQCDGCRVGPLCDDCAADHVVEHKAEEADEEADW